MLQSLYLECEDGGIDAEHCATVNVDHFLHDFVATLNKTRIYGVCIVTKTFIVLLKCSKYVIQQLPVLMYLVGCS